MTLGSCGDLPTPKEGPCLPFFVWQCGEIKVTDVLKFMVSKRQRNLEVGKSKIVPISSRISVDRYFYYQDIFFQALSEMFTIMEFDFSKPASPCSGKAQVLQAVPSQHSATPYGVLLITLVCILIVGLHDMHVQFM